MNVSELPLDARLAFLNSSVQEELAGFFRAALKGSHNIGTKNLSFLWVFSKLAINSKALSI